MHVTEIRWRLDLFAQEVAIALCSVVMTYLPEVQSAGIEIMNEKDRREREAAAAR